jgi:YVTN family beta-propeller protein
MRLLNGISCPILLAALAVLEGGCDMSSISSDLVLGTSTVPLETGVQGISICVQAATTYQRYAYAVSATGQWTQLGDPEPVGDFNDCSYGVGPNGQPDIRPNFTSQAAISPNTAGLSLLTAIGTYNYVRTLPFTPVFLPAEVSLAVPTVCNAQGVFYEVNRARSTVIRYSACPPEPVHTLPVVPNPLQLALTPDLQTLLVTNYGSAVTFIDTSTDKVIYTLQTGAVTPYGIAISPDGGTAYITNYNSAGPAVVAVGIAAQAITGTIPVAAPPKSIFLTPDGSQAWVTFDGSATISVIDTLTSSVAANLKAGGTVAGGIVFNPTGTRAFAAAAPGNLVVFDTATLNQVADIGLAAQPIDIVMTPDGSRIYANGLGSPAISIVDAQNYAVLSTFQAPGPANGLTLIPMQP